MRSVSFVGELENAITERLRGELSSILLTLPSPRPTPHSLAECLERVRQGVVGCRDVHDGSNRAQSSGR
jgi:hypothetical protein